MKKASVKLKGLQICDSVCKRESIAKLKHQIQLASNSNGVVVTPKDRGDLDEVVVGFCWIMAVSANQNSVKTSSNSMGYNSMGSKLMAKSANQNSVQTPYQVLHNGHRDEGQDELAAEE